MQEFSSHAPDGRDISSAMATSGAPDPSSGFAQSAPVNAPAPAPPMLGREHEAVHTEFGTIKVAKPAMDAAHRAAKLVEE